MAMTTNSPEFQELLKLLQEKFGLPDNCVDFTLSAGVDKVVEINVTYVPGGFRMTAFWILVAFLAGCLLGWVQAHHVVADECRKLGSFYVGRSVFKCLEETRLPEKLPGIGGQTPAHRPSSPPPQV